MKKILTFALLLVLTLGLIPATTSPKTEAAGSEGEVLTLDWKLGQLYDQPENEPKETKKRRYAIITDLKPGDVIEFTVPSDWGMWCYPADDNGAIGSEVYFNPKDGDTYTVAQVNGKMPNRLRVCVYSLPDFADITDAMWARCGLKFTLYSTGGKVNAFDSLTWEKGAFYDTATPNTGLATTRRYSVLPCELGDTVSVVMPTSNWRIYAYPADENGSIDGKWVELKNGSNYIVKTINDRTPTNLRITVCPNPDKEITDALWQTFDVLCYVEKGEYIAPETATATNNIFATADWQLGSYYGNAVHGGVDRRYAVFPCKQGDTFNFDFTETDFGLWVYYYDKNGEISDFGYTTVTQDTEIKITEKNGKVPTELRISVYPIAGGNISDAMWEKFDVVCTQSSDFIRVATMNYGLWNDGVTKFVPDNKVEKVLAAWKKMLDDNDVDILAGQEWLEYFDRSNNFTAKDYLFGYKYPYQYSTAEGFGKNLVSKTECTGYKAYSHTKNKERMYTVAYTMINGKKVCLINAHLSIETDFNANRKAEYEDLLKIMDKEEYVIVFGDFNAYKTSEFDVFKEAGYTVVNGGEYGKFNTWTNFDKESSWTNKAIDNIIVSSNIKVLSAKVDRRDLSDHNMLIADLYLGDLPLDENEDTSDTSTETSDTSSVGTTDVTTDGTSDTVATTDTASNAPATLSTNSKDDANSGSSVGMIVAIVASVAVLGGVFAAVFLLRKKKVK